MAYCLVPLISSPRVSQTVRIGLQVKAHNIGLFINDVVEEAEILVRKAVVILLPDVGGEQIVQ
jgi:hypothetical protein